MKIALAADHAGFALKACLIPRLRERGDEVADLGTDSEAAVDYPDFAAALGREIAAQRAERGILICGSGVGASIAANKLLGVRAGLCHDTYSAHQGVEHDDMNVLVLGSRVVGTALAEELVEAFLRARFSHGERHQRRLTKLIKLDQER
jgi:RpiB/LacA/LacB family sugar-phosphate isomerase